MKRIMEGGGERNHECVFYIGMESYMGMVLFGKCRGCAHLINLINIYIYMEI
jgi:hypothetical protein